MKRFIPSFLFWWIMKTKYETENEILAVVESFENGTISRNDWKHAEHLTVALYYLSKHDLKTATDKMRSGISNLLRSFGVDLLKEMPYHETLTVFWMLTVDEFNRSKNCGAMADRANELVETFDKNYPLRFYTREFLFSDEARAKFVDGDL